MPTIRCPSCRRALNVPEQHLGALARCPLCRHTFRAPAEPDPPPPREPLPAPGPVEELAPPPVEPARRALDPAGAWLQGCAALLVAQTVFCSWFDLEFFCAFWLNRSDVPARLAIFSTRRQGSVTYPDSGKVGAGPPWDRLYFRRSDAVPYWD